MAMKTPDKKADPMEKFGLESKTFESQLALMVSSGCKKSRIHSLVTNYSLCHYDAHGDSELSNFFYLELCKKYDLEKDFGFCLMKWFYGTENVPGLEDCFDPELFKDKNKVTYISGKTEE